MGRYAARMRKRDDRGLVRVVVGDGVALLLLTAASLVFAGGFALFLAASGEFLPHDIQYLGMSAADLCSVRILVTDPPDGGNAPERR